MPKEDALLIGLVVVFVLIIAVLLAFIAGLFSPFWCDTPLLNLVTCTRGISKKEGDSRALELPEEQEQDSGIVPGETQAVVIPTPEYGDLEEARSLDPALDAFVNALKSALEGKDFETLGTLMGETVNIGPWASHYSDFTRVEAIDILTISLEATSVTLDISNQGMRVAQEYYVTPREAEFALLSTGWPERSILGITKIGDQYFWTDLVLGVP